jgi:hypothetical protein
MTRSLLFCWQSIDWKVRTAVGLLTFAAGMLLGAALVNEPPSRLFAPAWQPRIAEPHEDVQAPVIHNVYVPTARPVAWSLIPQEHRQPKEY